MMNLKNLELNNQKENSTSYFKYDNSEAEWNKVLDDPERKWEIIQLKNKKNIIMFHKDCRFLLIINFHIFDYNVSITF